MCYLKSKRIRKMDEIQKILMDELKSISKGGDIKKAKVVCDIASQYIYTARLAVENKAIQAKVAKFDDTQKEFMSKDFSDIKNIKVV
jgi:hypothetical protein